MWQGSRDLYDATFPWVEAKGRKKDRKKPWLDDLAFKELVGEKGNLYSRKVRGCLDEGGQVRLVEVTREVNRMRRHLKRASKRKGYAFVGSSNSTNTDLSH